MSKIEDDFERHIQTLSTEGLVNALHKSYIAGAERAVARIIQGERPDEVYNELANSLPEPQGALH